MAVVERVSHRSGDVSHEIVEIGPRAALRQSAAPLYEEKLDRWRFSTEIRLARIRRNLDVEELKYRAAARLSPARAALVATVSPGHVVSWKTRLTRETGLIAREPSVGGDARVRVREWV